MESGYVLQTTPNTSSEPVFVLTSDVDWASDSSIEAFAAFAEQRAITPTMFVTHRSPAIEALRGRARVELGIHPNFSPGSTHGEDIDQVIASLLKLVPKPIASRNHRYLDGSEIARGLAARSVMVDSNICLFLQTRIEPQHHWSGILRLPCFWEDDVHWERGFGWDFEPLKRVFFSPGLKILNVHPFMFALNTPDGDFYRRHKRHISTLTAESANELKHRGAGVATFLSDIVDAVYAEGLRFVTLEALIHQLTPQWVKP